MSGHQQEKVLHDSQNAPNIAIDIGAADSMVKSCFFSVIVIKFISLLIRVKLHGPTLVRCFDSSLSSIKK